MSLGDHLPADLRTVVASVTTDETTKARLTNMLGLYTKLKKAQKKTPRAKTHAVTKKKKSSRTKSRAKVCESAARIAQIVKAVADRRKPRKHKKKSVGIAVSHPKKKSKKTKAKATKKNGKRKSKKTTKKKSKKKSKQKKSKKGAKKKLGKSKTKKTVCTSALLSSFGFRKKKTGKQKKH